MQDWKEPSDHSEMCMARIKRIGEVESPSELPKCDCWCHEEER